jgi:hypothetical protein
MYVYEYHNLRRKLKLMVRARLLGQLLDHRGFDSVWIVWDRQLHAPELHG